MPLPIDQVITVTTADEIETEVLSLCATAELSTSAWQDGSVVRTIITILSQVIAAKSELEPEIAKGGLGDLASPEWAKIWAQSIYDVLFVEAASATGTVDLANSSATVYTPAAGELIVANTNSGQTYRNLNALTIPASGSLADVAIQADIVGIAGDAAPGEITTLVSALVGVTVTNPVAVLGADEETTSALVARTRAKLGSLSPLGPKDAYNYVAQTPELAATSTPITRSKTTADSATGEVTVYCATAEGAPISGDIDIVQAALDKWAEPWCVTATAVAANELSVDITYQVWIRTSLTSAQVQTAIELALLHYLASVPVGGVVVPPDDGSIYVESITHVIHTTFPGIERVLVTIPAADLDLAAYEVPVLGTITPTITII